MAAQIDPGSPVRTGGADASIVAHTDRIPPTKSEVWAGMSRPV